MLLVDAVNALLVRLWTFCLILSGRFVRGLNQRDGLAVDLGLWFGLEKFDCLFVLLVGPCSLRSCSCITSASYGSSLKTAVLQGFFGLHNIHYRALLEKHLQTGHFSRVTKRSGQTNERPRPQ